MVLTAFPPPSNLSEPEEEDSVSIEEPWLSLVNGKCFVDWEPLELVVAEVATGESESSSSDVSSTRKYEEVILRSVSMEDVHVVLNKNPDRIFSDECTISSKMVYTYR